MLIMQFVGYKLIYPIGNEEFDHWGINRSIINKTIC
jgi:hypothetical protein